jgi:hypothetical protein
MQIKDLIAKLEALYNTYDDEYKNIAGEPEIMIDVFKSNGQAFEYQGFSGNIVIDKSQDGAYDILSAFYEDHCQSPKTSQ